MRVAEGARDGVGTGGEYGRWCDVVGNPWAYSHGTGGPKNTRGLPILSYDLPILYYEFYL